MKERPIIFSGPMVRAILRDENPKTQTRRIMKPQLEWRDVDGLFKSWAYPIRGGNALLWPNSRERVISWCPYGQIGGRLWVRETWKPDVDGQVSCITFSADGHKRSIENTESAANRWIEVRRPCEQWPTMAEPKWRPSIHMPRWASRITLENAAVRVERLQDISEADAIAEGIEQVEGSHKGAPLWRDYSPDGRHGLVSPILSYGSLWDVINGSGSWDANPWVWVIEFKRLPGVVC